MFETSIKAILVMFGVVGVWLLVQAAWRRVFACDSERPAWCTGWRCNGCQSRSAYESEYAEQQPNKISDEVEGE